jgi:hypothetical protein
MKVTVTADCSPLFSYGVFFHVNLKPFKSTPFKKRKRKKRTTTTKTEQSDNNTLLIPSTLFDIIVTTAVCMTDQLSLTAKINK